MKTYMLKEGVAYAIVPGHGKLYPGQTISGDYAMLVPGTLREVAAVAVAADVTPPLVVMPVERAAAPPELVALLPTAEAVVSKPPASEPVGTEGSTSAVSEPVDSKEDAPSVSEPQGAEGDASSASEPVGGEGDTSSTESKPAIDLPPPDTTSKVTTSGTVAIPPAPKGHKGSRR